MMIVMMIRKSQSDVSTRVCYVRAGNARLASY